jgi:hypothetical protein
MPDTNPEETNPEETVSEESPTAGVRGSGPVDILLDADVLVNIDIG